LDYHSDAPGLGTSAGSRIIRPFDRGDVVARAKRTDRAEARRRYRAFLAQLEQEEAEGGEAVDGGPAEERAAEGRAAEGRAAERDAERASAPRPGQRLGIFAAMKAATRPVHYIDDLRYTPRLITGSPAVWLPSLIAVASAAVAIWRLNGASTDEIRDDVLFQITVMFVLSPYVMLPGLIAGFFAPRASWLAGVLAAFVTTISFGVVVGARPELLFENGASVGVGQIATLTATYLTLSLPMGAALAAFSAWYKRFLELTGSASARAQQKAAARKRAARKQNARRR
jgi:hypothetical protein